jgi:hypothetical protein
MMLNYLFAAFAFAGVHAQEVQDQTRRLRQQRYAKSQKASKVVHHALPYFESNHLHIVNMY